VSAHSARHARIFARQRRRMRTVAVVLAALSLSASAVAATSVAAAVDVRASHLLDVVDAETGFETSGSVAAAALRSRLVVGWR
jgi:hypothetical protein